MNHHHKPEKLLYKLNLNIGAGGIPLAHYDADTPFPAMSRGDEVWVINRRFQITAIRHEITQSGGAIDWLTTLVIAPVGE